MLNSYNPSSVFADPHARKLLRNWALACMLILAGLWGGVILEVKTDRNNALGQGKSAVKNRVASYAEQLDRTINQIDQLSLMIAYQYETNGITLDLREQFRFNEHYTPIYSIVLNARGVGESTRDLTLNDVDLSDLPMFNYHRKVKSRDLLINPPSMGRASLAGEQVIRFTRRIDKPDGSFNGVVVVTVRPDYLKSYVDENMQEVLSVAFLNGMPFTNQSEQFSEPVIRLFKQAHNFSAADGFLWASTKELRDGQPRLVAWQRLRHYPLVTMAATKEADVLETLNATESAHWMLASLSTLITILACMVGGFSQARNAVRKRHFDEVQSTFRLAVDGAREAFYMFRPVYGQDGTVQDFLLEDCNERAAEMWLRTRAQLIGTHITELMKSKHAIKMNYFILTAFNNGFFEDEIEVRTSADQSHRPGWYSRRAVRSGQAVAITIRDITESRQHEASLARMASTDALTLLPNRHWLNSYLPTAITRTKASGKKLALLFIDVDNFKKVNDSLGHKAGDEVLTAIAHTLRRAVRAEDHVVRLGGDEFTVIIENLDQDEFAGSVAAQIVDALRLLDYGSSWPGFQVRASIGIGIFPSDASDTSGLLQSADLAMYAAKASGKAQFRHFDAELADGLRNKNELEQALSEAIAQNTLLLHYQPRVHARTGLICSFEALLRWEHPVHGLVTPETLIATAEESNLIHLIGAWVVEAACLQIAAWRKDGLSAVPVSINVSASQLRDAHFRETLSACLSTYQISPRQLGLELTDSTTLNDEPVVLRELYALRAMGMQLQIDDFGAGYSSLSQLQQLDIDAIKIDKSLVKALGANDQGLALCEAMVQIGKSLGISVVAEGVETVEQLTMLRDMGCDEIQGFLLSRPVPAAQVPALLAHPRLIEPMTVQLVAEAFPHRLPRDA